MCGISGIFGFHGGRVDTDVLRKISSSMESRGPDGSGEWIHADGRVGLAHRRLSIISPGVDGSQPMASHDNKIHIVFNGEIYNFEALRSMLAREGSSFRSNSDTEVLLVLYQRYGLGMVAHLRGMFAFAIWDEHKRGIFLARDGLGIKPLYYAVIRGTLYFASQVKALSRNLPCGTSASAAGYVGFLLFGSVPEPDTLFTEIKSLAAGHTLWFDERGMASPCPYWTVTDQLGKSDSSAEKPTSFYTEAIRESVDAHLVSDVPVGIFLSSGLDSTTLAAMASKRDPNLQALTLNFAEFRGSSSDEAPLAKLAAEAFGIRHTTFTVTRQLFEQHQNRILDAMDQPTIDGLNSYFISLAASSQGLKVALSGIGGDEWFSGYPTFNRVPWISKIRIPSLLKGPFERGTNDIFKRLGYPKYAGIIAHSGTVGGAYLLTRGLFLPSEVTKILDRDFALEGLEKLNIIERLENVANKVEYLHSKVIALELSFYTRNQLLRDADWAGMANSVEIRTPLLDVKLTERIAGTIKNRGKISRKKIAEEVKIPDKIVNRKKTGFTVPLRNWMVEDGSPPRGREGINSRQWALRVLKRFSEPGILNVH